MKRFKAKKAALDVSINSIVVIIFAIVMLGLGIVFIRGMFGEVTKKINVPESELVVSPSEPLAFPPLSGNNAVNRGEKVEFTIKFYNNFAAPLTALDEPSLTCNPDPIATAGFNVEGQAVQVAQTATYKATLKIKSNAALDTYICTLQIGAGTETASKQFYIEVK